MDLFTNISDALGAKGGSELVITLAALIVLTLFFYIGRLFFRASVDRKVRSIDASAMAFMSLDEMRKRGLISAREHKEMRSKMAQRTLREQQEADKGATVQALAAVEIDPAVALRLVRDAKPDDLVKASLAGLGRPQADPEEGWRELEKIRERDRTGPRIGAAALEEQRAKEDAERVAAQLARQLLGEPPPPEKPKAIQEPEAEIEIEGLDEIERPTRPKPAPPKPRAPLPSKEELLADPLFAKQSARDTAAKKKKTKDIDQLYAKGLISQEEYERLLALFDKA